MWEVCENYFNNTYEYNILEKNAKWFLKKTQNYCTNLFVLFSMCFIIVYKFFFFENEKRSKHFLKLSFLLIFQIKSFFKFLSKWVKVKMNMEEKKLQTKQKSNTRKIQLQVNLCQSHSHLTCRLLLLSEQGCKFWEND